MSAPRLDAQRQVGRGHRRSGISSGLGVSTGSTGRGAARSSAARVARVVGVVTAALTVVTGCSSPAADRRGDPSRPAPRHLVASVTQFRFEEGTRNLKAGVTNNGDHDIVVSRASIVWVGLAFPSVPIADDPVLPGQTAAFTIAYGTPRCPRPRSRTPVLVADVDGRRVRLPLRVEDPGLLRRLRAKACAQRRLDRVVSVDLEPARRTERIAGEEYLPAALVLRHRSGVRGTVDVVDLGGSVLIELRPRAGRRVLPSRLDEDRRTLRLPLLLGSAHRCDDHALGQSSQTFLFSAYLRVEGRPTQRQILPVTTAERDRIISVVRRDCR